MPPLMLSNKQRLLRRAAELVGFETLAARLNVPPTLLDAWMGGLATMPDRKLLPLADVLEGPPLPKK